MMRGLERVWCVGVCLVLGTGTGLAESHAALMPAPRSVEYGTGRLTLAGVQVKAEPLEDAADRFNVETLTGCLAQHGGSAGAGAATIVLRRTGASEPWSVPGERVGEDSREAYTIAIDGKGAEVKARSSAGVYYGVQTLCQMMEGTGWLPEAKVRDWPSLAYRGTMVDISEGQMVRVAEIKKELDVMARLKMNQYYLYNELTIALDGLPPAAPGARMSKDDVREVVRYARERHIEVIPCLELYGHLHDLFRREEYSDLADFPHGVEFDPGNPKVHALLEDWAAQYMDLFPSPFVHIGFDETWQLQQAAKKGSGSPTAYFVEQLQRVNDLFQRHGKTVMAWADIMVKYPDIIRELPKGLLASAWYYDPRPDPEYKKWIDPLAEHKQPFLVASGVNGWSEIAPDYKLTFDNIDTLLAAGRKRGTLGLINTIWSDDVQMLKRPVLPGIAYGAVAAWQEKPVDREHFFAEYAEQEWPGAGGGYVAAALTKMAEGETALEQVLGQETMLALWQDPFTAKALEAARSHGKDLREARLDAEVAERELLAAEAAGVADGELQAYLVECRLMDYAGMKFQYAVEIRAAWDGLGPKPDESKLGNDFDNLVVSQQHGKIPDLMEGITELKPQYEEAWLREFTSYRLRAALGRWDAEYEYWRRVQAKLFGVLDGYDAAVGLPEFERILPKD